MTTMRCARRHSRGHKLKGAEIELDFWLISILWQWPPYLIHTDIDILMSNITVTQLKQIRQIINGRELLRIRMFLVYV